MIIVWFAMWFLWCYVMHRVLPERWVFEWYSTPLFFLNAFMLTVLGVLAFVFDFNVIKGFYEAD